MAQEERGANRLMAVSKEIETYIGELRDQLNAGAARPPKGELLARSDAIELVWPEAEFPADRPLADQFSKALAAWGAKVHRVSEEAEVMPKIAELIRAAKAKKISRFACPRLDKFDWHDGLGALNLEWIMPTPEEVEAGEAGANEGAGNFEARRAIRNRLAEIEVGITDADLAVAHTGTLLFRFSAERSGLINLFPWTTIAIVWEAQMVRTVEDLIRYLGEVQAGEDWPCNTVFATGPSRSADIDLTVGQGAAGPGRVHIVLIENGTPGE